MPIRRTLSRALVLNRTRENAIRTFMVAASDDATDVFFDEPFHSAAEARRWWPRCAREVWLQTHRGNIPRAARCFDLLRYDSIGELLRRYDHTDFDAEPVIERVTSDLTVLDRFRRAAPKAARALADVLDVFEADLARIAETAEALEGTNRVERPYPGRIPAGTYGHALGRSGSDDAA